MLNTNLDRPYYIYILLNPLKRGIYKYNNLFFNYEPYYIGRGKYRGCGRERIFDHLYPDKRNHNNLKKNIINLIKESECEFLYEIHEIDLSREEANKIEMDLIYRIGRQIDNNGPLSNMTYGGDGSSGYKWSDDMKEKKSLSMMGEKNHFYNKSHKSETKVKMSRNTSARRLETRKKMCKPKTFKNGVNPKKGRHREDLSKKSIDSIKNKLSISILQLDTHGVLIKIWKSSKEASKKLNIKQNAIVNCLKGRSKTSGGYKWEYNI